MSSREITLFKIILLLLGIALISIGIQGVFGSAIAAIMAPQILDTEVNIPINIPGYNFGGTS